MRKLGKCFLILMFLWGVRARAQTATANLTAQDTGACTTANACLTITLNENQASSVVQLNGTFSATLQFEGSSQSGGTFVAVNAVPVGGTTAVTSATSTGAWRIAVAGLRQVRVRCSSFVSGTVAVVLTSSQGSSANNTSSSGGAVSSVFSRTGAVTAASGDYTAAQVTGALPDFASYIVFPATSSACTTPSTSGTTYCALNSQTGAFDYNGTDIAVVVNNILTANATVGGKIFFKNGVYSIASATQETLSGCSNFYGIGIPGNALGAWVQWVFEGESRPSWPGEEVPTSIQTNGVIFNVTAAAITAAGSSFLAAFWQRPLSGGSGCALPISVDSNELYFKNMGVRFPTNTRGNTGGIIPWAALTVDYENVLADFNMTYGAIDTGPAPIVGTTGSFGLATTYSGNGNLQHFKDTYAVGYDTCYDVNSEHAVMDTATAIYCNYPAQFGRVTSPGIFHPIVLTKFSDQENLNGFKLGPGMLQGSRIDMFGLDLELGAVGKWYARTVGAMTEANAGYTSGLITYITVQQNSGIVAELPGANLFTSGGQGFQFLEGTHSPNLALNPVSDTFTRPNSTASSHTNGLGPAWLSGTQTGNFNLTIASNAAQVNATGASTGYSFYVAQPFNNDQFAKWTCASFDSSASTFCEVATNAVSTPNVQTYYAYYCSHVAAGGSGILKNVAAVSTTLASQTSSVGCNAADTIELRHIGNTLWAYRNGALDTNFTNPVTDSSITNGSPGGILSQDATAAVTATNWSGGSMPALHGTDSIYNNAAYNVTPLSVGVPPTPTGTGACATITTQVPASIGSQAGSLKCTGTTGASTITLTFPAAQAAPNGFRCNASDETTVANVPAQSSHTRTTCVLTIASVTANDVIVWGASPF